MMNSSTTPTIAGASNAELRMLTVEAIDQGTGMFNSNAHPRVYRVKFVVATNQTQAAAMQGLDLTGPHTTDHFCSSVQTMRLGDERKVSLLPRRKSNHVLC